MVPENSNVIFLGDILSSYNDTAIRPTFDKSIVILKHVFDTFKCQVIERYHTIADVAEKFQTDLAYLYRAYQFDVVGIANDKKTPPKFSKITRRYDMSKHVPSTTNVRFVLGNNDLHVLVNILHPLSTNVDGESFKITSDPERYNIVTPNLDPNVYDITVDTANLLYTFFTMSRLLYYKDDVLYIHYGGNIHIYNNVDKLYYKNAPFRPSKPFKIICGHEKMFGLVRCQGILTCYFDMSKCTVAYNGAYEPKPEDMFITVERGQIKFTNTNYMLREDIPANDVHDCGQKMPDVRVVGKPTHIYPVTYDFGESPKPSSSDDSSGSIVADGNVDTDGQ